MASESVAAVVFQKITHTSLTFLDACRLGKLQLVQQLISDSSCDLTISDDDGNTGLHLAATHGHLTVVETLVSGNSLPSPEKNEDGKTPLHLLCTTGYAALMKRISPFDYTSQYMVALNGIANTVTLLLSKFECSSDVKTISDKVILHQACHCGDIELVRKLLSEKCSDPMARDSQGFTPLHIAVLGGSEEVATELINRYKCPVNCVESLHGRRPFYYACESGNVDLVRILISECGSNPIARDSIGNTALHVAAMCGREEVVRELVDRYKCPVDCVGYQGGQTVLHNACGSDNVDLVRKLISEYGLDPMARDSKGATPLHMAALNGREEVVIELVSKHKCPVDSMDSDRETILHYACWSGNVGLVRKLISEYGLDPMARDNEGATPLHTAALIGREEVVIELASKHKCPVDSVDSVGRSVLHKAAQSGNVDLVRKLISEYGLDPLARDNEGATPLHTAALNGREEVVIELASKYKYPVDSVDSVGRSVLHKAAQSGNVYLVRKLISEYGLDPMARDSKGDTPLHKAAFNGSEQVVIELINKYKCPVACVNSIGRSVLHIAAQSGNVHLVRKLILMYRSNILARDKLGAMPLHVAALAGKEQVVKELINRYKCPAMSVDHVGQSVLHYACQSGNIDIVKNLISSHGCDPMAKSSKGTTSLHMAALSGKDEVVRVLVDRYKCAIEPTDTTLLISACQSGNVHLVKMLIWYGSNPMAINSKRATALHLAALYGREEVVRVLVNRYTCSVNRIDANGDTALHKAAENGHVSTVRLLVSEFGANASVRNTEGRTSLHVAATAGHSDVVRTLINEFGCNPNEKTSNGDTVLHLSIANNRESIVTFLLTQSSCDPSLRGHHGRTPLHIAAACGYGKVVTSLLSEHAVDPMCVDYDGNTPLHIAALCNKVEIIKTLTNLFQCFPCIRNNQDKIPFDLAVEKHNDECINELALYAEAATVPVLPKVLVVGSQLSGKTTLVKALKTSCTESPVDFVACSCGIQLIRLGSGIGEVTFFELPCEPTLAAAVEILTSTSSCSAIVIVDVSKGMQKVSKELGYWLSFLSYSCKLNQAPLRVTVVGSHVDILAQILEIDAQEMLVHMCRDVNQSFYCGNVKITGSIAIHYDHLVTVHTLKYHLEEMIALASVDCPADVSNGAIYLLKLLQKELKGKSMCQLSEVSELVTVKHFYPDGEQTELLLVYLRELETHGFLQVVGDNNLLVLNITSILSTLSIGIKEVTLAHGASEALSLQKTGIITEDNLGTIFPNYTTDIPIISEYLSQLQLCMNIADPQHLLRAISHSYDLLQSAVKPTDENSRYVFFPSCIYTDNAHCQKWIKPRHEVFSQGFFLKATERYQYIPLRFFHLLLLRIAFAFIFPASSRMSQLGIECCTLWKSGIRWVTLNGVEMFVKLAEQQKGIVIAGRSDQEEVCVCENMLSAIIENIEEAKSEFLKLEVYLIDPGELKHDSIPESDAMHLFDMTEIQNALVRKYESVSSVDRTTVLPISQISQLQKYTLWSKFYCYLCSSTLNNNSMYYIFPLRPTLPTGARISLGLLKTSSSEMVCSWIGVRHTSIGHGEDQARPPD